MQLPWHLYVMALIYLLAGLNHFRVPRLYQRIIPAALPNPTALNYISGAAEIILAICLCIPVVSQMAAWGIIALLIAVFPANIYMYINAKASMQMPKSALLLRLPLQLLLAYWAWLYT